MGAPSALEGFHVKNRSLQGDLDAGPARAGPRRRRHAGTGGNLHRRRHGRGSKASGRRDRRDRRDGTDRRDQQERGGGAGHTLRAREPAPARLRLRIRARGAPPHRRRAGRHASGDSSPTHAAAPQRIPGGHCPARALRRHRPPAVGIAGGDPRPRSPDAAHDPGVADGDHRRFRAEDQSRRGLAHHPGAGRKPRPRAGGRSPPQQRDLPLRAQPIPRHRRSLRDRAARSGPGPGLGPLRQRCPRPG